MNATISLLIFIATAFLLIAFLLSRIYKCGTKKIAYIRSGHGKELILLDCNAFALPILHHVIPVNLATQCLNISAKEAAALLTQDLLKLDITVDFYVKVPADEQHIILAGQTLGKMTTNKHALKYFLHGKFVNVLREISATMPITEILENQRSFSEKVHQRLEEEIHKNGLLLESTAIQNITPTSIEHYQQDNQIDAKGKTHLAEEIAIERKKQADIEQKTDQEIKAKEIELEKLLLEMEQKKQNMRLEQNKQIELCQATIDSDVAKDAISKRSENSLVELKEQHAIELEKYNYETELLNKKQDEFAVKEIKNATQQHEIDIIKQELQTELEANQIINIAKAQKDAAEIFAEAEKIKSDSKLEATKLQTQAEEHKFSIEAEGIKQISDAIQTLTEGGFPERLQDNLIAVISGLVRSGDDPVLRFPNIGNSTELIREDNNKTSTKRNKLQALLKEANHSLTQEVLDSVREMDEDMHLRIGGLKTLASTTPPKRKAEVRVQ